MTTKYRIVLGFSMLLVLLVVMAFFGFTALQTASSNFVDYRRLSGVNVGVSDLQSAAYETVYYAQLYMSERKPQQIAEAKTRVGKAIRVINQIRVISHKNTTLEAIAKAQALLGNMENNLDALQKNIELLQAQFNTRGAPQMAACEKALMALSEGGRSSGRSEPLYFQILIWRQFIGVRENLEAFMSNMTQEASTSLAKSMAGAREAIANFGKSVTSDAGIRDHALIKESFEQADKAFGPIVEAGTIAHDTLKGLAENGADILAVVIALDKDADTAMNENGVTTLASNNNSQRLMMIISIGGVLTGAILAVLIVMTLVRTLARMALFASDIAGGNFDSRVMVTEKGEIGAMFAAMRRIPEIFSGVVARCNDIANDIASGLFRDRLDLTHFNGGFRDLAQGVNTIADSYTRSIDALPVGIITITPQHVTRFTNTTGEKMVGNDALKAFGGNMPILDSSIQEGKNKTSESRLITPNGATMEVAATALPLHNLKGGIVAGMAVLTDISEIKEKQNIMLKVANEASLISDRVAAASEELAAQVEQVSRGAEIQRERVESTASAMSEMNATVSEVARSASDASQQSAKTRNQAESGATLVNKVVSTINEVNAVAVKLQENMEALGHQAENIGSVMNVISDIADQTNLLALNAAIEAARAGEAGRGFAVVADEVRKLAENTMNATKEVGGNIAAIQQSAQNNIREVGGAVTSVAEATNLANESGEALQGIVGLASDTSSVVESIATAAEEQSAASDEITRAIDEINRLVAETTEGMIQSSAAVQDLSKTAQELRVVMERLR